MRLSTTHETHDQPQIKETPDAETLTPRKSKEAPRIYAIEVMYSRTNCYYFAPGLSIRPDIRLSAPRL
ncbi:hypothetical protein FPOAC1_007789 [Fusarium poae]|uniref:hypothetical protein n=1 Tax=Fusarium poae TaxID=36050 RepID=UPI001CE8123E|nr:hypothetical protein FPOAC1_007789 [Fusarium poae]KAG8668410.1 hypothetical protein FPOAC1_007789 [Fusarium poae]